ncbi:hypothetical protein Fmac_019124 [Flemingia macrophylla]|uniref:Terpene synthase 2 n=1 Tax=Flemingia macrophylla TaxID=520843 RepID=A0ABD1M6W9_9FABA
MSFAASVPVSSTKIAVPDISRPYADFPPNIWKDFFLQYDSESLEIGNNTKQQAQILKEEVEKMFQSSTNQSIMQKLSFIDLLQRFGISYHFEQEINQTLEQIYKTFTKDKSIGENGDHHFLTLLFRLLRQQGYQISSNIFNKFKNEQGNFNITLANDIQGLCNLYEAAQMRTNEDDILEEAWDFSKTHLKLLVNQVNSFLALQINHCLRQPLNKNVPRFEARFHMTLYEQEPSHNKTLLTFAKVDFNILQKMHQKEIGSITKSRKKSNFVQRIPFARDRSVESYLWALAMSYKPEHRNGRMFAGKTIAFMTTLDDTYDAFGTIQELELFTQAIMRWDISLYESLPQCMKAVFDMLVELCEVLETMTNESKKSSFVVPCFKQAVSTFTKGYMVEAKWCHEGYIPTYNEYKMNGILTTGIPLFVIAFTGPGELATKDVFDWIFSDSKIIEAAATIGRFMGDISSHKFEQERVHIASAVECCMKQYDYLQSEAYNHILNDVEDCWKVLNEACLKPINIPKVALDCLLNLARSFHFLYEDLQDIFTNPELMKDYTSTLLVDPVCINQD